jgi:hypothetical protein
MFYLRWLAREWTARRRQGMSMPRISIPCALCLLLPLLSLGSVVLGMPWWLLPIGVLVILVASVVVAEVDRRRKDRRVMCCDCGHQWVWRQGEMHGCWECGSPNVCAKALAESRIAAARQAAEQRSVDQSSALRPWDGVSPSTPAHVSSKHEVQENVKPPRRTGLLIGTIVAVLLVVAVLGVLAFKGVLFGPSEAEEAASIFRHRATFGLEFDHLRVGREGVGATRCENIEFDVKKTDSLVSPIVGVISYKEVPVQPSDTYEYSNYILHYVWHDGKWAFSKGTRVRVWVTLVAIHGGEKEYKLKEYKEVPSPAEDVLYEPPAPARAFSDSKE